MEEGGVREPVEPTDEQIAQTVLDKFGFIVVSGSHDHPDGYVMPGALISTKRSSSFGHAVTVIGKATEEDLEAQRRFIASHVHPLGLEVDTYLPPHHTYLYKVVAE